MDFTSFGFRGGRLCYCHGCAYLLEIGGVISCGQRPPITAPRILNIHSITRRHTMRYRLITLRFWALAVLFASVAIVGCSRVEKPDEQVVVEATDQHPPRARYGTLSASGFEVVRADLNGDGKPDQWTFVDQEGRIVRVERDLNFNGRIDMWQYFDEAGDLIEEEMDLDLDGIVDVVTYYKEGRLHRREMSTGFDGSFPITKFYDRRGQLLRVERDSTGDGRPDVWEYYEKGERVRIGWDTDGDGQADTFDML